MISGLTFFLLAFSVQAADFYYTNRTFKAITFNLQGTPPADILNTESKKLNNIVPGSIKTNSCYALEKKTAFAWGYPSGISAWNAAANYSSSQSNYSGKLFDNVGWVRGTKSAEGNWGAFLWTIKNHLEFKSSETDKYDYGSGWVVITNVMVRGLTNYPPMSDQSVDWPDVGDLGWAKSNYPGDNQGEEKSFQVDLTTYFQLALPDISVSPPEAVAAVGGGDVQFTAVGTNIPQGVTWSLIPDLSGSDGAAIQAGGYSASVTPGTVPQVYKIRAAVSNCPDFYDEAELTVVRVVIDNYTDVTYDGEDSGNLICRIEPEGVTPLSYAWSAGWYTPAYNNPQVTFEEPSSKSTRILNAHWYARTTNSYECDPAYYDIHSTVQINGMSCSNFYAAVFCVKTYQRGGWCERPRPMPITMYDWVEVNGYYMVIDVGDWFRINAQIHINYTANSQFYAKVWKHEQQHKNDYDNGFDGRVFCDENEFAPMIIGLTNATISGLNAMVNEKYAEYESAENAEMDSVQNTLEERAYAVSDAEPPFYVYQGGGL